jgi:hypothetical protein
MLVTPWRTCKTSRSVPFLIVELNAKHNFASLARVSVLFLKAKAKKLKRDSFLGAGYKG